jgi:hypothetical protein
MDGLVSTCQGDGIGKLMRENGELRLINGYKRLGSDNRQESVRYESWVNKLRQIELEKGLLANVVTTYESYGIYYLEGEEPMQFRIVIGDYMPYGTLSETRIVGSTIYRLLWIRGSDKVSAKECEFGHAYSWLYEHYSIYRPTISDDIPSDAWTILSENFGTIVTRNGDTIRISDRKMVYIDIDIPDYVGCYVSRESKVLISTGSQVRVYRLLGAGSTHVEYIDLTSPIVQQVGKHVLCADGSILRLNIGNGETSTIVKCVDHCATRPQISSMRPGSYRKQAVC